MAKIVSKFSCTLHNFNCNRNGVAKIVFKAPTIEMAQVANLLTALLDELTMGINCEGKKEILKGLSVDKVQFDKEGEATITFVMPASNVQTSMTYLSSCSQKPVVLFIKSEKTKIGDFDDDN